MFNSYILDYDDLLKKSYGKLKIKMLDDPSSNSFIIALINNFAEYFPEIKILKPSIILSKAVAYYLQNSHIVMTTDKLYDFVIISYNLYDSLFKNPENFEQSSKSTIVDNDLFDVYSDILYNYDSFDDAVKIQIPNLLVDLVTVLLFKSDPYGKSISSFQIKHFYKLKKEALINKSYSYPLKPVSYSNTILNGKYIKNSDAETQVQNKTKADGSNKASGNLSFDMVNIDNQIIENDLLCKLKYITNRDIDLIKNCLSKLSEKEIKKLYDICNNYNKIMKYNKIDNIKDFKVEIEREVNRNLSNSQIRHSKISIRKVQFYIESLLDSKFEPHLTHGINHVKHNFEYGYRLAGLLEKQIK